MSESINVSASWEQVFIPVGCVPHASVTTFYLVGGCGRGIQRGSSQLSPRQIAWLHHEVLFLCRSILSKPFLKYSDIEPGMVIEVRTHSAFDVYPSYTITEEINLPVCSVKKSFLNKNATWNNATWWKWQESLFVCEEIQLTHAHTRRRCQCCNNSEMTLAIFTGTYCHEKADPLSGRLPLRADPPPPPPGRPNVISELFQHWHWRLM